MNRLIAIVEDDEEAYRRLSGFIERISEASSLETEVRWFPSSNDFLKEKETAFAIIFLDVELPGMDGLSLAKRIRENNQVSSIVFVTNLAKFAQYGYEVDAISYLIKPVSYDSFAIIFRKALNAYAAKEDFDYIFKVPGGIEKISIGKLMYVEVLSHIIVYHLIDGTIEKTGTLNKVEALLRPHGFLRCHSAYLVNPKFISGIKNSDVQLGSESIPLARSRKKEFLEELSQYYVSKAGKNELR